jgi:hypothetical protein
MAAIGRTGRAGPALSWPQAVFLAGAGAALAALACVLLLGVVGLLAPGAAASGWQAFRMFWLQIALAARDVLQVATALVRAVYAAPAAWPLTIAMLAVVVAWACVVANALAPRGGITRAA